MSLTGGAEILAGVVGTADDKVETELLAWSMPANVWSAVAGATMRILRGWIGGRIAANASSKTLRFYAGATLVFEIDITDPTAQFWRFEFSAFQYGSTKQNINGTLSLYANDPEDPVLTLTGAVAQAHVHAEAEEDPTAEIAFRVTGQNGVDTADDGIDSTDFLVAPDGLIDSF